MLPELQAASAGGAAAHPILLADALKFVTVFRGQLPAEAYGAVIPLLASLLTKPQIVVHTYAAIALERMLTFREPAAAGAMNGAAAAAPLRFGAAQLAPLLQGLLTSLFGALKLAGSTENQYTPRASSNLLWPCGCGPR